MIEYIKYDQGGVIMDVINPEQVRDPALSFFTPISYQSGSYC